MRLRTTTKKGLAGGLAFASICTGLALTDGVRHGLTVGAVIVVTLLLGAGFLELAGRRAERS